MGLSSQSKRQGKPTKRKASSQRSNDTKSTKAMGLKTNTKDKKHVAASSTTYKQPLRSSGNILKNSRKSIPNAPPSRSGPGKSSTNTSSTLRPPLMFQQPKTQAFLPPKSIYHSQNENIEYSQLSESQGSAGFGSITMGQRSLSQPSSKYQVELSLLRYLLHDFGSTFSLISYYFIINPYILDQVVLLLRTSLWRQGLRRIFHPSFQLALAEALVKPAPPFLAHYHLLPFLQFRWRLRMEVVAALEVLVMLPLPPE
jgi:hypothetical protein